MKPFDPRLLRYASAARAYLIMTVALGLAGTGLILAQAGLLAQVLATAGSGHGLVALRGPLIVLIAVLAGRAAVSYGGETSALRAAAAIKSQLRRRLMAHALRLGPGWLTGQRSGEVTTLATRGLDALDSYFARYLPQLVLACLVPVAVLTRVAFADPLSAVVIAVTLPLIPVFAILVGLHTKAQTRRQWALLGRLGGHFLDVVEGLPTLKVFGRARAQAEIVGTITDAHRRATMKTLRVAFLSSFVLELAATLATALVAVEVGLRLLAGHLDYRTALLVLLLTPEAYLPLRNVGAQFHASAEGTAAADQAFAILDTPPPAAAQAPSPGWHHRPEADLRRDTIRLDGITVTYPDRDQPALQRVSLVVKPGEHLTLTGPSGAGKSSLLAVLLRFTEPLSGHITVGGADLRLTDADSWRTQIAWVPQQPHLFAGTIAANIALGQPGADHAAINWAAEAAGAADFITVLPGGYSTLLGERGLRLSAGQRQKIALARAFLKDAPLLLLDEPTAHLDPLSAAEISRALRGLMLGRTVIEVTHHNDLDAATGQVLRLEDGHLTVLDGRSAAATARPASTRLPVPVLASGPVRASWPAVTVTG